MTYDEKVEHYNETLEKAKAMCGNYDENGKLRRQDYGEDHSGKNGSFLMGCLRGLTKQMDRMSKYI